MGIDTLLIMRHAKSSWNHEGLSDHERPLNKRGVKAARVIGDVLRAKGEVPAVIWSSDSQRTRETVDGLGAGFGIADITYLPNFYHAPANKILYVCDERGEPNHGPLMLVGHNPGWEDLFYHFSGMSRRIPTGACAIFKRTRAQVNWLDNESWRLSDLLLPRDLER